MLCPRGESIPSWYEDRCELRKYGVTGSIGFPDNPELSGSRRNNRANGRFPLPPVRVPGIAGSAAGRVPVIPGPDRRCATLWWPRGSVPAPRSRAIGSAGERLVHTEEVTGSIPVSPTSNWRPSSADSADQGRCLFRPRRRPQRTARSVRLRFDVAGANVRPRG